MLKYLVENPLLTTYNNNMANVIVEGHGTFSVNSENLRELIQWLETNNAAQVENTQKDTTYGGDTLLNESSP